MNQTIISCLNIIKNNNFNIDMCELKKLQNDDNSFYTYLFKNLTSKDLSTLVTILFKSKSFVPIFYSHYSYLCCKVDADISELLFRYLVDNGISPHLLLESININSSNVEQYRRIASFLKKNVASYSHEFEKESKLLYDLKDKIQSKYSYYEAEKFENLFIFPLSRRQGNQYLDYALKQLKIDITKIEILEDGIGSFSWCFKLNDDLVLKNSCIINSWYIPMFYRINDFVIRRNFGKPTISVSPYANINDVNNFDIQHALDDFDRAGLELCDGNYSKNFGMVDYKIPDSMFRDVTGITKYLDIPESDYFKDRKIKLIDQDFIYFKDSKSKKYGAPIRFK